MTRIALAALLASALLACDHDTGRSPGIEGIASRVVLDRSEAYVGDPLGVTIEVEVPQAYELQAPQPADSAAFLTDRLDAVSPEVTPSGTRYAWRWTLRPRLPGAQALPALELSVSSQSGAPASVRLASLPLWVRSVREEQPERRALFDIRAAAPTPPAWMLIAGLAFAALIVIAVVAMVRSRRQLAHRSGARRLAQRTLERLAEVPEGSPRDAAEQALRAARDYLGARWSLEGRALSSADLPEQVDPFLRGLVSDLEHARFRRVTDADAVGACLQRLREYLRHAAAA